MITFPKFNIYIKNNFTKINNTKTHSDSLNFNNTNLAPLAMDTVTFTGRHKRNPNPSAFDLADSVLAMVPLRGKTNEQIRADKAISDYSDKASFKVAKSLYDDLEFAHNRFKSDISQIFSGIPVLEVGSSQFSNLYGQNIIDNLEAGKPILAITARRKSPESIAEKMNAKGIKSKKAAKERITDFSGIRIILPGKNKNEGNYVLDKLANAIRKGWISISEIEVFHNPELRPVYRYAYANEANLHKVETVARKQGVKDFRLITKSTESGYPTIHMLVNLPGNIKGELQIISLNVLELKDIEDMCYKVLTNKKLDSRYSDIEALLTQVREDTQEYADFMEYTRQAYALERKKELGMTKQDTTFLNLPKDNQIPKELDFNSIALMKKNANAIFRSQKFREMFSKYVDDKSVDCNSLFEDITVQEVQRLLNEECYGWVR